MYNCSIYIRSIRYNFWNNKNVTSCYNKYGYSWRLSYQLTKYLFTHPSLKGSKSSKKTFEMLFPIMKARLLGDSIFYVTRFHSREISKWTFKWRHTSMYIILFPWNMAQEFLWSNWFFFKVVIVDILFCGYIRWSFHSKW